MKILFAVLMTLAGVAHAADYPQVADSVRIGGKEVRLATYLVEEKVSAPNETLHQFMLDVSPILEQYTKTSRFEACAVIGFNSDTQQYGVQVVSNKGSTQCFLQGALVPAGMTALNLSVHSHPQGRRVFPSNVDINLSGGVLRWGKALPLSNEVFSKQDIAVGPGYIVTKGKVFFQTGPDNIEEVGVIGGKTATAVASN